jgi:hypothetical protein
VERRLNQKPPEATGWQRRDKHRRPKDEKEREDQERARQEKLNTAKRGFP